MSYKSDLVEDALIEANRRACNHLGSINELFVLIGARLALEEAVRIASYTYKGSDMKVHLEIHHIKTLLAARIEDLKK